MNKEDEQRLSDFSFDLRRVANMLDRCKVPMRGQKTLQQKTRLELTKIKQAITEIKKITIK